ncbi:MAG: hypothetical protein AB3N17_19155 [Tateyamaria sp.]
MKVVLHIGAHRTGTTSFQAYLRQNSPYLETERVGFWGPMRTRKGLFAGIQPVPGLGRHAAKRARGRIALQLDRAQTRGINTLIVSDENMLGTMRRNTRSHSLYQDVGERMARFAAAFDGRIDTVLLTVRALDHYWSSLCAYSVARGYAVPNCEKLSRIATSWRSWRDVVADLACAVPEARVLVVPFERTAGRPDVLFEQATGLDAPETASETWLNRSPSARALRNLLAERGEDPTLLPDHDGRWTPFDTKQRAALRETYLDDIHWLTAGADGLATLIEDTDHARAGQTLPRGSRTRGQAHDIEERRLAGPG